MDPALRWLWIAAFVEVLAFRPQPQATQAPAQIVTCFPPTLGSEAFRAHQVWEFELGKIVQPATGLCLSVSNGSAPPVQDSPAIVLLPCVGNEEDGAANQTWALRATGQILLAESKGIITPAGVCNNDRGCCIDVPGYSRNVGSDLHLWPCTLLPPNTHFRKTSEVPNPTPTMANEQWTWEADGAVVGLQSGLCLSAGGNGQVIPTCALPPYNASEFCNQQLTPEERAQALVATANLSTLVQNLGISADLPPGFRSEGVIPPTFHEALHGVCCGCGRTYTDGQYTSTGCPTSFPHALALGATFNRSLWNMVGAVIGIESRALRNQNGQSCRGPFFTPNVNLYRDPRWGRGMEVPGEDPTVTGEYGREFVSAMQARNGSSQRAMCMPKHWLAYDLEGRKMDPVVNYSRNSFNAVISKQQMVEFYLPAWHATIRSGQASGVMCSTNAINGIDACMNPVYLKGFLRDRFNFTGAVVTDGGSCGNPNCVATVAKLNPQCASCANLMSANSIPTCPLECGILGAKLCLESGTDIELGTLLADFSEAAINQGAMKASTVASSAVHLYANLVRAGLYDHSQDDALGASDVDTQRSRRLAFEAATDAMVLLKNDNNVLPLQRVPGKKVKISLIGPHLNSTRDLLSSTAYTYDRTTGPPFLRIEEAFRARESADFIISGAALGCNIETGCQTADVDGITSAVHGADIVVAFMGLHPASGASEYPGFGTACAESEAQDRVNISLCGQQEAVLETAVRAAAGAPLVVVMINGGTISLGWVKTTATALLNGWYPGQAGGEAIAAVVFGDRAPSGRLPVTIYDDSVVTSRDLGDMDLRSSDGLTYMHYRRPPVYPFGWGLAYTKWSLALVNSTTSTTTAALAIDYNAYYSQAAAGNKFKASCSVIVSVTNVGQRPSSVVVQIFAVRISDVPAGALPPPQRQLVGFARGSDVTVNEVRDVTVGLAPLALCRVDENGTQWVEPSRWTLMVTVDGNTFQNSTLTVLGSPQSLLSWPSEQD